LAAYGVRDIILWDSASGAVRAKWSEAASYFLDFTPDGRLLMAQPLTDGGTPWIVHYDPETRQVEPQWDTDWEALKLLLNGWYDLFRSPDGSVIAGCSADQIRLWNAETGALLRKRRVSRNALSWTDRDPVVNVLRSCRGAQGGAEVLALFPKRHCVAVGSSLVLWLLDTRTGRKIRLLACGDGTRSLVASPDGSTLASGHSGGALVFWSIPSGRPAHAVLAHTAGVSVVAYSPDGSQVVSASNDREIKVWDTGSGECVGRMPTLAAGVEALCYSQCGMLLASGHEDGGIRTWDVHSGALIRVLEGAPGRVLAVTITPDGRRLVSARYRSGPCCCRHRCCCGSRVDVWDLVTGEQIRSQEVEGCYTRSLSISPDGQLLVHAAERDRTQVRSLADGELRYELKAGTAAISPDGSLLATGTGYGGEVQLWELATGTLVRKLDLAPKYDRIVTLRFSPDGSGLFAGFEGFQVARWEIGTGRVGWMKWAERDDIHALAVSPDGSTLALGAAYTREVWLWDLPEPVERMVLMGHRGNMRALVFSPDGHTLASGNEDASIKLWNAETGALQATLVVLPTDGVGPSPEWIYHTPAGDYLGSPSAERFIR
jgi:WD40 repeat protein